MFSKAAEKQLCGSVAQEDMGARPLRRKITSEIEDMLSAKIVRGELYSGCSAKIVFENGKFGVLIYQSAKTG